MRLTINGEARDFPAPLNIDSLLTTLGLDPRRIAFERNLEIVPRSEYQRGTLTDGDRVEIVHFIGGGKEDGPEDDGFVVSGRKFKSRLIVGTGKYKDFEQTRAAVEASGADMVTVAANGAYNVSITGGTNSIAGTTTFGNTGTVTIGDQNSDSTTFTAGVTATAPSQVNIAGAVAATTGASTISLGDADTGVSVTASATDGGAATGLIEIGRAHV